MSESSVGLACLRDNGGAVIPTTSTPTTTGASSGTGVGGKRTPQPSGGSRERDGGQQDMYVTLNSAAQHSPDTVWTLPGEQQLPDSTPLLTSREVEAVVDAMEDTPMPQFEEEDTEVQQASAARAKVVDSKDNHINNSRGM